MTTKNTLRTIFALLGIILLIKVEAQNYTALGGDKAGDATLSGADIDSVFYAIDTAKDSVWFKITTHDKRADFAFYIFIDGDENPVNGLDIFSPMSRRQNYPTPNLTLKMDNRFIFFEKGLNQQGNPFQFAHVEEWSCAQTSCGGSPSTQSKGTMVDSNTFIVRCVLSDVDNLDTNGRFNLVVTSGTSFFGKFTDFSPNTGHFSVPGSVASGIGDSRISTNIKIYPNPSTGKFTLDGLELGEVTIYSITGSEILKENVTDQKMKFDLQIPQGAYIIVNNGAVNKMLVTE